MVNYATWIWDPELVQNNSLKFYNFIMDKNIKRVFIQIDPDIPYTLYQQNTTALELFDVKSFALGGDPAWLNDPTGLQKFMDYVRGAQAHFVGIHIDIEPYQLPEWNTDQAGTINKFKAVISQLKQFCIQEYLRFEIDIPFWYSLDLNQWLLENVDEVCVMAYRSFAVGQNGINLLVSPIISQADRMNKKLTVAVETLNITPTYTSFYSNGETVLLQEVDKVIQNFKYNRSFNGIAVHDIESWMELKL